MINEIIQTIEGDHIKFFKRYLRYNYTLGQLVYVHIFNKWQEEEEIWLIHDLTKAHPNDFKTISEMGTIIEVIKKYYPDTLEMGNDSILETAQKLHVKYIERIRKFHKNKIAKALSSAAPSKYKWAAPKYTPLQAFRELVMRGFIPITLSPINAEKGVYYLKWQQWNLVYPEVYKNMTEAMEAANRLGIPGFTGIHQPK